MGDCITAERFRYGNFVDCMVFKSVKVQQFFLMRKAVDYPVTHSRRTTGEIDLIRLDSEAAGDGRASFLQFFLGKASCFMQRRRVSLNADSALRVLQHRDSSP